MGGELEWDAADGKVWTTEDGSVEFPGTGEAPCTAKLRLKNGTGTRMAYKLTVSGPGGEAEMNLSFEPYSKGILPPTGHTSIDLVYKPNNGKRPNGDYFLGLRECVVKEGEDSPAKLWRTPEARQIKKTKSAAILFKDKKGDDKKEDKEEAKEDKKEDKEDKKEDKEEDKDKKEDKAPLEMGGELEWDAADGKVEFKGDWEEPTTAQLTVKNKTGKRMAFKIKCSDNDLFKIRPVMGIMEEGKSATVSLTFTPKDKGTAPSDPHHFSLYQTEAKDDATAARKIWEDPEAKKINRIKKATVLFTKASKDKKKDKKEEKEEAKEDKKEDKEDKKEDEDKDKKEDKEDEKDGDGDKKDAPDDKE